MIGALPGVPGVTSFTTTPVVAPSTIAEFVVLIVVFGLALLFAFLYAFTVITGFAVRPEPDPTGRRSHVSSCFWMAFIAVIFAVFGSVLFVMGLVNGNSASFHVHLVDRLMVVGIIMSVVGLAFFLPNVIRGRDMTLTTVSELGSLYRVARVYTAIVTFVFAVLAMAAAVAAVYFLLAAMSPSVFGSANGSGGTLRMLVDNVYLLAVSWGVIAYHRNLIPPGMGVLGTLRSRFTPQTGPQTAPLPPMQPITMPPFGAAPPPPPTQIPPFGAAPPGYGPQPGAMQQPGPPQQGR